MFTHTNYIPLYIKIHVYCLLYGKSIRNAALTNNVYITLKFLDNAKLGFTTPDS